MNSLIQTELDMVEEYVLNCLFINAQNPQLNSFVKSYLAMSGKTYADIVNNYINTFEAIAKPFLKDNGYVDGAKLSQLLKVKFKKEFAIDDFRLIEAARSFEPWISNLGAMLR